MDSQQQSAERAARNAERDLAAVKRVFERIEQADALAGIEELVSISHDDVEMRAYAAREASELGAGELLQGKAAVLDFFRRSKESGFGIRLRTKGFEAAGEDTVLVRGSIRVARPDGSFAEANVRWRFHFRDGLVDEVGWEPRAGD
jgi:ketosteroid isomerase-like protein